MLKIIQSILKSPIKRQYLQGDSMFYIQIISHRKSFSHYHEEEEECIKKT